MKGINAYNFLHCIDFVHKVCFLAIKIESARDGILTRSSNLFFFEILGANEKKKIGIFGILIGVVVVETYWGITETSKPGTMAFRLFT
jgi:hypothetical protein